MSEVVTTTVPFASLLTGSVLLALPYGLELSR